jgi:hypothetical protein
MAPESPKFINVTLLAPTRSLTSTSSSALSIAPVSIGSRASLINLDVTTHKILGIQLLNGLQALFSFRHLYEAKATRASGEFVGNYSCGLYLSKAFEKLSELIFCGVKGQVSDINVNCGHFFFSFDTKSPSVKS